eukprot:NODE_476_length_1540_cov_278.338047.p1 GENE.NODE_476_length_1540_cov_278.338047~~NODE_476_length_1540_cov_278.338047.p1  ORF type:complete len:459 (-),score=93.18 NODE_476_length_1540_cov_278.338047:146-1522(-)
MGDTLTAAVSSHMDENEVQNMAHICFKRVLAQGLSNREDCAARPDALTHMGFGAVANALEYVGVATSRRSHPHTESASVARARSISSDVYLHAALATNRLRMSDFVSLFDRGRMTCFLERFFMPLRLRTLWTSVAKTPQQARKSEIEQPQTDQSLAVAPVVPTRLAENPSPSHGALALGKASASCERGKGATDTEDAWVELDAAGRLLFHDTFDKSSAGLFHEKLDDKSAAGAVLPAAAELDELRKTVQTMFTPIRRLLADAREQAASQDRRITKLEAEVREQAAEIDALRKQGFGTRLPAPGPPAQRTAPVILGSTDVGSGVEGNWTALEPRITAPLHALPAAAAGMTRVRGCANDGLPHVPSAPVPTHVEVPVAVNPTHGRTDTFAGGGHAASAGTFGGSHAHLPSMDALDLLHDQLGDLQMTLRCQRCGDGNTRVAATAAAAAAALVGDEASAAL